MKRVPFAFCQSVVSLLSFHDYSATELLPSTVWQNAIDAQFKNRINVECRIGFHDGVWVSTICVEVKQRGGLLRDDEITFEELQKLNERNLHIKFEIKSLVHYARDNQTTFEDVSKLAKFAVPFVTALRVYYTKRFPQNDLLKLLSFLRDSSITQLSGSANSAEAWTALSVHLASGSLRRLTIDEMETSAVMKSALPQFVLRGTFSYCSYYAPAFLDMDMFNHLFNKPATDPSWTLWCYSSIKFEELRAFEKNLQVSSKGDKIEWKRQDGRVIIACPGGLFWIRSS